MLPLYIVVGFVFLGIVVLFVIYYSKGMKMTSYTDCQVVKAELEFPALYVKFTGMGLSTSLLVAES